ncbi:hypothetical protein [Actinoplanes sp. NPDC049265]|uniref:hypothetical protein n=1 Tax=Actinoplanes sp. NPDC049265 TaxID=3363902 RepID=UPI0037226D33
MVGRHPLDNADLSADLDGVMRALAARLGIDVPADRWAALVDAATLPRMRAEADRLVPNVVPVKDRSAFFREGRSGAGARALKEAELARFRRRTAGLAPPDVVDWLCRP